MSILLYEIKGSTEEQKAEIAKVFWGGEIGSEVHPKYKYHCTVLPIGWREITEAEFARSNFFHYTPKLTGWIRSVIGDAKLFFMHDETGFAMLYNYHEETVKMFKFGCRHVYTREEIGRCMHKETCTICGHVQTVDTSD